ncbi:MAG: RluA family pseudouridine synthase [Euryarchaeota archaeon]|mgnify:FL=1|nr:RluA family pseudouridine synthase [Euryarchaeota archaeon]MBT3654209.1 RluA family pseudouridine synthase [Euryarchaeota archaeon]MBT3757125.1 RluA family pseudouridine synthase [Euryarchaeota archaeon]MBT4050293.1 RluA family pseudouridine synthase [Euryarchaeota archaeon]MBT4346285.1 RluA family pseudouridine synthase [Euryarchaeota archaeon]
MPDPSVETTEDTILLEVLASLHPTAKRNSLRRMVDHGRVRVGQERATRANAKISAGVKVTILSTADGDTPKRNQKLEMPEPSILFSDIEIIVADKPAGLLAVATDRGEFDTMFDRMAKWAWENGKTRAYLVHRLDRETSGCMIFSRSAETRDFLQSQFKLRTIERIYHAVIHGKPANESGTETTRIQETKDKRVRLVSPGRRAGKEAITHWSLEKEGPVHSLVRIKIDTGRRAQIRLHMAALTTPVVGDTRHGFGKASVNRLCLHASSLEFDHPNGARQAVESPIPKQLLSELNRRLG